MRDRYRISQGLCNESADWDKSLRTIYTTIVMTAFDPDKITFFANTDARGKAIQFGIKAKDRQRHMYVVGKTGMGKSTLLENMAAQDIRNGEGMAFIDPHGSAAETLLNYVPEHRVKDVVYFAPFDLERPISFNVMEDVGPDKRHLVVSGLMSTFKKIWVDAWSARMEYILTNALLALIEYPDTTLLSVNRLFVDKSYRERVIEYIKDPAVKAFWRDEFAGYTDRFAAEALPAIQNKIGQFTGNPLIRNIIGQPYSSFDIRKLMDERKILIMNLSKGLIGETNANLLGSMLTTRIYLAAMSRADLPLETMKRMPNFYFYVDEFQSFANSTFANILSEARKYHLNLIIAHQYIEQMEEDVRNAVFGNVGTTIAFRVGPFDAEVLETVFAPRFEATDLVNLGFAQIYLTLMIDGIGSQPFSAETLPPIQTPPISCRDMVISSSRNQYGKPRAEVEELVAKLHDIEKKPEADKKASGAKNNFSDSRERPSINKNQSSGRFDKPLRTPPATQVRQDNKNLPKPYKPVVTDPAPTKTLGDLRAVLAGMVKVSDTEVNKNPEPDRLLEATVSKTEKRSEHKTFAPLAVSSRHDTSEKGFPAKAPSPTVRPSVSGTDSVSTVNEARKELANILAGNHRPVMTPAFTANDSAEPPTSRPTPDLQQALVTAVDQIGPIKTLSNLATNNGATPAKTETPETVSTPKPVSVSPIDDDGGVKSSDRTLPESGSVDLEKVKRILRQSEQERSPFG